MEILCIYESENYIGLLNKDEIHIGRLYFKVNKCGSKIFIDRLYINLEYRKIGLASFMINRLFEMYTDHSFYVTALSDNEDYISNKDLIKFYKKFGFKKHLMLNKMIDGDGTVLFKE